MARDDGDLPDVQPNEKQRDTLRLQARARALEAARGKTLWDIVEEYTLIALTELRVALDVPDARLRFAAARDIAAIFTKMPPRPALPPQAGVSPEEYEQRLNDAEADPAVRAWLKRKGWTEPKIQKEQN